MKYFLASFLLLLAITSCKDKPKDQPDDPEVVVKFNYELNFNKDSAYHFVAQQVAFGPRVPGTAAHAKAADYLRQKLSEFTDTAFIQEGEIRSPTEGMVNVSNVIGSIKPELKQRVLLCAHWDTRPWADEDPERPNSPSDGANDGASGVGVLLEMARQLQLQSPRIGVDFIFFDAEDMGTVEGGQRSWCLGSQYWSANKHKDDYQARFGILLDMVGSPDATFAYEMNSMNQAAWLVKQVWRYGSGLGYGRYFQPFAGGYITDDHLFVSRIAGIPTIDVIHYELESGHGFGSFWHTHEDNMDGISRETLEVVGKTVLKTVYEEH